MAAMPGGVALAVALPAAGDAATAPTFTLTSAALSISAPATAALQSAGGGSTHIFGELGTTTVIDGRGDGTGWTVSDISTASTSSGTITTSVALHSPSGLTAEFCCGGSGGGRDVDPDYRRYCGRCSTGPCNYGCAGRKFECWCRNPTGRCPTNDRDHPRAQADIVDHLAPGAAIHRHVEVSNASHRLGADEPRSVPN